MIYIFQIFQNIAEMFSSHPDTMRIFKYTLLILLSLKITATYAQLNHDSLKSALSKSPLSEESLVKWLKKLKSVPSSDFESIEIIGTWLFEKSSTRNQREIQATSSLLLGAGYVDRSDFKMGSAWLTKAQKIAIANNYPEIEIQVLNNLGALYHHNKQIVKAIEQYQEAARLSKIHNYTTGLAKAWYNLGGMYFEMKSAGKDTVRLSLKLMWDAVDIVSKAYDTLNIIKFRDGISQVYTWQGKLDSALWVLNTTEKYVRNFNNESLQITHYLIKGMVNSDLQKYQTALQNYFVGLQLAKQYNSSRWVYNYYTGIAETYEKLGNFKAANYYNKLYSQVHDSLVSTENFAASEIIRNKYEKEKNENTILRLSHLNNKKTWLNRILAGIILFTTLLVLLGYTNIRHKTKIRAQREELQRQRISEFDKDKQLAVTVALLRGQEEERSRLARDLHDGLGVLLSGTKLSFTNLGDSLQLTNEQKIRFSKSIALLDNTIKELRKIAQNMMPEALISLGFAEAVNDLCDAISVSTGKQIIYLKYGQPAVTEQTRDIICFRIVQELINNAVRHANADKILVQISFSSQKLTITVEDNGNGFTKELDNKKEGSGLANIRQRVQYLNGTIDIQSEHAIGTSVHVEINQEIC